MDHVVSSLILSSSFFFPPSGTSQARSPGLSGNLPCDIWLPALRQRVKRGPGAHFMEMQKSSATHDIQQQDFYSRSLGDVSGFGCSHHAAAHQQFPQAETFERTFPRRSKQQNHKAPMSKKIFPWMKESRHSDQKRGRRIAGVWDTMSRQPLFTNEAFSFMLLLTSS